VNEGRRHFSSPHHRARFLLRPFQVFFERETSGSILLLASTATALLWANSPLRDSYFGLWEIELGIRAGGFELFKSLHHWINDGLMAIFFFVIGLEIKREVLVGELATLRKAALPLAAALGGMIVPALIYAALNGGSPAGRGWGVPMATDIAFALGVLALLGPGIPNGLKVFLAALAIVDDLGAVLVIAIFYSADLSAGALIAAALIFLAMILANRADVRYPAVYLLLGFLLWLAILRSGVHATIAGILAAMAIPATSKLDPTGFAERARAILGTFEADIEAGGDRFTRDQGDAVHALEKACEAVETPLARLEHDHLPWVAWFIMPLFALANAGVVISGDALSGLAHPAALGVIGGLVLGKQLGVMLVAFLAVRIGVASLPAGVGWRQIYGVACLCGIGFTMSLFIANLAFIDGAALDTAKTGVLAASLIAGLWGWTILRTAARRETAELAAQPASALL
jgi:Na+:H+ antiporter, NhaA family